MHAPLDVCPVRFGAMSYPEQPAWLDNNDAWSYRELDQRVSRLCQRLADAGVRSGDYLVTVTGEQPVILLLLLAAVRLQLILAPVNGRLPATVLQQQLATFKGGWCYAPECHLPDNDLRKLTPELFADLNEKSLPTALIRIAILPHRPLTAVFTSGSSGPPKAAVHSYANHYYSALGSQNRIPLAPGDRWLVSLPLYHVGGLAVLFRSLQAGSTLVGLADQQQLADALTACKVTHLSLVSTQLSRLLPAWEQAGIPPALRFLLLGGSQIAPRLITACRRLEIIPYVSYGLTEMSSQVCTGQANPDGRVGDVLPERELKLDEQGQILVRGRTLFLGYLNNGKLNLPVDADGWFATKDRGHWQHQQLMVDGRLDNLFISGGENIQPEWIEQQLLRLEGVTRTLVVSIPDPEWGQAGVAFIDAPGQPLESIRQRAHALLYGHLYPKHWLNWPAELDNGLKPRRGQFSAVAKQRIGEMKKN